MPSRVSPRLQRIVMASLAASLPSAACGEWLDSANVASRSPAMVLLSGATEVRYRRTHSRWVGRQESEQLYYFVDSPFPSQSAICELVAALKRAGWRPRHKDGLSIEESSYTHGWRERPNRKDWPDAEVEDIWSTGWINQNGDHLGYFLTFRSPAGERNSRRMRVAAYLTPGLLKTAVGQKLGDVIPNTVAPRVTRDEIADCAP